jgi:hypothetical protein
MENVGHFISSSSFPSPTIKPKQQPERVTGLAAGEEEIGRCR